MSKSIAINHWGINPRITLSQAVKRGNLLFISGITARDERGETVAKGDIKGQTRQIYNRIKTILEAAGASFDNILMTTDYITTLENYKETAEVRREYFNKDCFPAATGIVVKRLINGEALIEIDAIALLD